MPKKTNKTDTVLEETKVKKNTKNKVDTKKTVTSKVSSSKKDSAKKSNDKIDTKKSSTKTTSKKQPMKKNASNKKVNTTQKTNSSKKVNTKDSKTTRKRVTKTKKADVIEYYDLPYRYNETIVKLLAQTPKTLFVYWDISDVDKENLIKKYSNDFFEKTFPVLIIHNETKNYSYEVEINDFANSWYLSVNDENCKYKIELGRKFRKNSNNTNDNYIYITTSNVMDTPNDHILINNIKSSVYFKNVKTGKKHSKNISDILAIKNLQKLYNIYQEMYKDSILKNPASESLSSRFM